MPVGPQVVPYRTQLGAQAVAPRLPPELEACLPGAPTDVDLSPNFHPGNGNHWTYTYDSLSRRLTVADPDLGSWSYVHDNGGRLTD